VALERREHDAVVRPTGELDAGGAPQLERALSAVQGPGRRVVLDLRGVAVARAGGLDAIVSALDRADRMRGELRVLPGEAVRRLFDDAGIGERLAAVEVADDVL
jgi:anti-anti-sigma factor